MQIIIIIIINQSVGQSTGCSTIKLVRWLMSQSISWSISQVAPTGKECDVITG
jgi:hypothetical protein